MGQLNGCKTGVSKHATFHLNGYQCNFNLVALVSAS